MYHFWISIEEDGYVYTTYSSKDEGDDNSFCDETGAQAAGAAFLATCSKNYTHSMVVLPEDQIPAWNPDGTAVGQTIEEGGVLLDIFKDLEDLK